MCLHERIFSVCEVTLLRILKWHYVTRRPLEYGFIGTEQQADYWRWLVFLCVVRENNTVTVRKPDCDSDWRTLLGETRVINTDWRKTSSKYIWRKILQRIVEGKCISSYKIFSYFYKYFSYVPPFQFSTNDMLHALYSVSWTEDLGCVPLKFW